MANIREVAKKAGVSPAAVSRILNNDPALSVTQETRARVRAVAREMGYKINSKASKAKFRIGILQWFSAEQEMADDYYLNIRKGIEDYCDKNSVEIVRNYRSDMEYKDNPEDLDGMICIGKFSDDEVKKLIKKNSNIVFVDMEVDKADITTIMPDLYRAAMDSLEYLEELGHKRIAYIGGVEYAFGSKKEPVKDLRRKAYLRFMRRRGDRWDDILEEGEFTASSGYELTKRLLGRYYGKKKSKDAPTAIFAGSDAMAIGAVKAIREAGLAVPDDISVIGINDSNMSSFVEPPLTTVKVPSYDMGQYAANILLMSSNLTVSSPLKAMVPCTLIQRSSCSGISII
ncbi:MAG: LacI family DNA-binding transcriptional regulator [Clostridiales bacterium]|nr:LacI family DNA-binding transcriptional regulator [Clostridiales bacterium]